MGPRAARVAARLTLLVLAVLVLAHLGRTALWDDEANTALFGEAVWRTGDSAAVHGDNYLLYRDGSEVDPSLHNRFLAPLPYLVEAPFIRETHDPFWARLPFALAGLGTVALLLYWLVTLDVSRRVWALTILAAVGNVSFILYSRQARYYTLSLLLCAIVTYAYAHRGRSRWAIVGLCAGGTALWATQYLTFMGLAAALAVDYVCWGHRTAPLSRRDLIALFVSHVVVCVPIFLIWYPLGKGIAATHGFDGFERIFLWLRTLRDMNNCEYGVGVLVLAAPLLYRSSGDALLLRLPLAIVVSTAVVTVLCPTKAVTPTADVRYVMFLIPACMVLGVRVIDALPIRSGFAIGFGLLAFQTTLFQLPVERLHGNWRYHLPVRSTLAAYIGELVDPPVSAYGMTAGWLRAHVKAGETAITYPDYAAYPLMFHAPHVVYGWQVSEDRAARLPPLPAIQLKQRVAPDWIIVFDNVRYREVRTTLAKLGASYERVAMLPATNVDQSRAEVFWHRFDAASAYDPEWPIFVYRRVR